MSISAFSSSTGKQLWGPVYLNDTGDEWGNYQDYPLMAYGIVFVADLGGYVYAVNATTGARLWTWNTGSGTYATPTMSFLSGAWPLSQAKNFRVWRPRV